MNKTFFFASFLLLALAGCTQKQTKPDATAMQQTDSLQRIIAQRDSEINDMMGTLNDIEDGFNQINAAENRLSVARSGEGSSKAEQIKENIRVIASTMDRNRQLIKKLQQQLRESHFNGDELKKTIANLTSQLEEKDKQLQKLRAELDAKDIHISELDETISNLNDNVTTLTSEAAAKSRTISDQDKQLNTAWFMFGTKKELKQQHILEGGKVLQSSFNKNYFTKIDIRVDKEIKLYSRSARILTMHPSGSYALEQDANKQYVLRITNPEIFWSTSKYLVIMVK